jgi:hypothetical protein
MGDDLITYYDRVRVESGLRTFRCLHWFTCAGLNDTARLELYATSKLGREPDGTYIFRAVVRAASPGEALVASGKELDAMLKPYGAVAVRGTSQAGVMD